MENNVSLKDIADKLTVSDNILIICHAHPDGDAIGSSRALMLALEAMGKNVKCLCADAAPHSLSFIFGDAKLYTESPKDFKPSLIVTLDTATVEMMGALAEEYGDSIDIKIDHHGMGNNYAKYNYVESEASATGEIVYELVLLLKQMNGNIADAVYTAIATDTGCFRYSNVTERTFETAAELYRAGANCEDINIKVFESKTKKDIAAMQAALNNIKYYENGSVALVTITKEIKKEYGFTDEEMHIISALIKEIGGVNLSIVIRQEDKNDSKFKISMRSKAPIDCSEICALFGGGGHIRASGASLIAASAEEAEKEILKKTLEALKSVTG